MTLADEADPLSVVSLTDTFTTNGRPVVLRYDAASGRERQDRPRGGPTTKSYDAKGHVVKLDPGSRIAPITYEYDDQGHAAALGAGQPVAALGARRPRPSRRADRRQGPADRVHL